jgi:cell division protein FtsW
MAAVFWAGLSPQFSSPFVLFKSKATFILSGIILAIGFSKIDYHFYENRKLQIVTSLVVIVFLGLLFFIGPEEFGANLRFLIFNKTVQPTEYVKIIVVFVLSYTITETYGKDLLGYFVFSIHSLLLGILFILIAFQPDYGAVLILMVTSFSMLIVARIRAKRSIFIVGLLIAFGGLIFLILCFALADDFYVLERLKIFVQCLFVSGCDEYQMSNAYNAIISGRFLGNNIVNAIHPHGVIPMECNDFIFCVIAEETGFFGIALLLSVYLLFIHRGLSLSKHCRDFFGQLMAFGLTWLIGIQAFLNILVAAGCFPITGVTLPFISHGGNSLLSTMIAVGILLNISKNTVRV